jgi:hypothetical protein
VPPNCLKAARRTAASCGWIVKAGPVPAWMLLLASTFPAPASAALGDTVASVTSDSQILKASPRVTLRAAYTVHELPTSTGTVIREFVASSGVVFAVSWRGPFKPSMSLLLGQYFGDYARAARRPGSTRSRLMIEQPNLIVHGAGHMRSFAGIAYVPQLLPANVTEADLE